MFSSIFSKNCKLVIWGLNNFVFCRKILWKPTGISTIILAKYAHFGLNIIHVVEKYQNNLTTAPSIPTVPDLKKSIKTWSQHNCARSNKAGRSTTTTKQTAKAFRRYLHETSAPVSTGDILTAAGSSKNAHLQHPDPWPRALLYYYPGSPSPPPCLTTIRTAVSDTIQSGGERPKEGRHRFTETKARTVSNRLPTERNASETIQSGARIPSDEKLEKFQREKFG